MIKTQHRRRIGIVLCILLLSTLFGCENPLRTQTAPTADIAEVYAMELPEMTQEDTVQEIDTAQAAEIRFSEDGVFETGDGVVSAGTCATVKKAGTYLVSGTCTDGQLIVDAGDNDTVCLIFQNVTLASQTSAAIYVKNAGKTVLNAAKDTVNTLSDAVQYQNQIDGEPDAAVYSKDDLTVNGLGTFQITGNYQDAVKSKDTLRITGSTLTVQSADDGICGKDFVCIGGGCIQVTANGDGVKSTYDTDVKKGAVAVYGGSLTVTAGADGLQAENQVRIDGGTVQIVSGGGTEQAANTQADTSTKGIKCGKLILITDGAISVNSADDAVHSNHTAELRGGTLHLQSGDDGVHADTALTVSNGFVEITESYEGLEAATVCLQGGEVHITASDDGVNASSGNTDADTQQGGKRGGDPFQADGSKIEITGGKLVVDADGDGIDSNGDISMSGGEVYVHGPTDGENGALDYAGEFCMTGGTLFAAGSAEMAQSISESSSVYAVAVGVSAQENTAVRLLRADGSAVCSFAPSKRYAHLVIASPAIQKGESYTVSTAKYTGGENTDGLLTGASYTEETAVGTFTAEAVSSTVGNLGGGFGNFGGGAPNDNLPNDLPQNANPSDGNAPMPNGGERPNAGNRPNRGAPPQESGDTLQNKS